MCEFLFYEYILTRYSQLFSTQVWEESTNMGVTHKAFPVVFHPVQRKHPLLVGHARLLHFSQCHWDCSCGLVAWGE